MKLSIIGALLFTCALCTAAQTRPNFLFIYTDDQRYDALGVVQAEQGQKGRYPWFKTPHIDRLAAEGVRFRNAFVTLPLCAPSRAAFLSGKYNHQNGVANNHTPFPESNATYSQLLKESGYDTAYIGKWHHGSQKGNRPGFEYSASFIGQGRYVDCPFEVNGETVPTKGWVDDVSTSYVIDYLSEKREKPFAMVLGFKSSHGPFNPPPRAAKRFEGETFRPVPNLNSTAIYRIDNETTEKKRQSGANLGYFRTLSAVDDNVGKIMETLEKHGLAENTVIVYTSDNGYYHGEHGLGDKRSLYEESIRVPMIVRYPKQFPKGKVLDEMVINLDIAPTFLEMAGANVPKQMQGRSLVKLMNGKTKDWRKSFLSEYFFENGFQTTPNTVAVRTDDAKLIKYPGREDWTELFDLRKDPYETTNLVNDPARKTLRKEMEAEFDLQVKQTGYVMPEYADAPTTAALGKPSLKPRAAGKKRRANR